MTREQLIPTIVFSIPVLAFYWLLWKLRGPSRRARERYWAYLAEAERAGRTRGPELEAEAREYAYRRRQERKLEAYK